jgi:hypothetical protein
MIFLQLQTQVSMADVRKQLHIGNLLEHSGYQAQVARDQHRVHLQHFRHFCHIGFIIDFRQVVMLIWHYLRQLTKRHRLPLHTTCACLLMLFYQPIYVLAYVVQRQVRHFGAL